MSEIEQPQKCNSDVVFEVICKGCGFYAIKKWVPDMKMTDIKDPCPRCGGTDWADEKEQR
jgi:hypothetical protein